jgi:hypothetical protein
MKQLSILAEDDDDPMLSAVNLVDVFLVLVVALLTAVAVQHQQAANESVTVIRNAGKPDMEIVVREKGQEIKYRGSGGASEGQGVRTGVAYRMKDGSVIYVPEPAASGPAL